jgi:hypothetical protein
MRKMSVHHWFIVGAVVVATSGCGVESPDESAIGDDTELGIVTAAVGSTCTPPTSKVTPVVRRDIGYGGMGKHGKYDWIPGSQICAWFEDRCSSGLHPMNVDTQSNPAYNRAAPGDFSCWHNSPNVICWGYPLINSYVYTRNCYVRPDGTKVDYGCGCPP